MTFRAPRDPGRPPASQEPTPADVFPAYVAWVEGRTLVKAGNIDREKRRKMGAIEKLLAEVGLHLHTLDLKPGESPDEVQTKARFSRRPVRQGEIVFAINKTPGLSLPELADALYRFEPWTDQAKAAAQHRLGVALNKISKTLGVVKVTYDPTGVRRYSPGPAALHFARNNF